VTERDRLKRADEGLEPWRQWGPYLSERAWGSVREDYSADGDAWSSFPHDHARSRAYRWNEDGMAGFCDEDQNWCLSLALWNGRDAILKERMFGLANLEGNHGEDVKEYWWYTDATPTHSWNSWRYHYPQDPYPYDDLLATNAARGTLDPEYELADTGVFDESRYWVVTVDYAKASTHDLLMRIEIENAGPATATLRVLPTLWFRNTWSWGYPGVATPEISLQDGHVVAHSDVVGTLHLRGEGDPPALFCDNETNTGRLYGRPGPRYPKDGINDHVIHGADTVNPAQTGTKAALDYEVTLEPGAKRVIRVRLVRGAPVFESDLAELALDVADVDRIVALRRAEADEFWDTVVPAACSADERGIVRQALSGLLWSKQYYHYDVERWLRGDPASPPPPPGRGAIRNGEWADLHAHDVILMPDPWEYPWFAAWDLSFHAVCLAHVDPALAKQQLLLLFGDRYMRPDGRLPAYEWNFSDVNPPTQGWAALQIFRIDGARDYGFLAAAYHAVVRNLAWWLRHEDVGHAGLFEGGFMGLDNIAPIDRSTLPASVGTLEQADATGWVAMHAIDVLRMSLLLARHDDAYEDHAAHAVDVFLRIAAAVEDSGMWDEEEDSYDDVLLLADGERLPLRVRSLVGLVPLLPTAAVPDASLAPLPHFRRTVAAFLAAHPELAGAIHHYDARAVRTTLLTLVPPARLGRILARVMDESRMLAPQGIRSVSAEHREHPFAVEIGGVTASVDYEPAESTSRMFGGNSNWRGPVWFPLNTLLIEALRDEDLAGTGVRVETPGGDVPGITLGETADLLSQRLVSLFLPGPDGRRPADARYPLLSADPRWSPHLLFYEYFDGDTGEGLGASHQTGWTALVAHLILRRHPRETAR
jgi:hypothetical protein